MTNVHKIPRVIIPVVFSVHFLFFDENTTYSDVLATIPTIIAAVGPIHPAIGDIKTYPDSIPSAMLLTVNILFLLRAHKMNIHVDVLVITVISVTVNAETVIPSTRSISPMF